MVVAAKQALKLRVREPGTLNSQISLPSFLVSLLVYNLINILVIIEKHWLLLEHFGNSDMPIGSPPMLIKLQEIVRVSIGRLRLRRNLIKLILVGVQMRLKLFDEAIIVPLVYQVN